MKSIFPKSFQGLCGFVSELKSFIHMKQLKVEKRINLPLFSFQVSKTIFRSTKKFDLTVILLP